MIFLFGYFLFELIIFSVDFINGMLIIFRPLVGRFIHCRFSIHLFCNNSHRYHWAILIWFISQSEMLLSLFALQCRALTCNHCCYRKWITNTESNSTYQIDPAISTKANRFIQWEYPSWILQKCRTKYINLLGKIDSIQLSRIVFPIFLAPLEFPWEEHGVIYQKNKHFTIFLDRV